MKIGEAIEKMTEFYDGGLHDIAHFLKVWAFARTIGEQEALDAKTQEILELAAVVHDIACPLCREKYGNTDGTHQEQEGVPLARAFLAALAVPPATAERVCFLVGHHHSYTDVDGPDYQILLEADFLVNADESALPKAAIRSMYDRVFKTSTGKRLLRSVYGLPGA